MATGTGNLPNQNMSFSPFAILTAEEMNDLVENIESLADGSGIGDVAIAASKISGIWWEEIGRGSINFGTMLTVNVSSPKKFMKVIISTISADAVALWFRINSDNSSSYTFRTTRNGTETVTTSSNAFRINSNLSAGQQFAEIDIVKLGNGVHMRASLIQDSLSAGSTVESDIHAVGTYAPGSSFNITSLFISSGTVGTSWASGTEMVVLGHD